MKKNLVIGLLSIVSISSIGFAFIQRTAALKYKILALENEVRAMEMKREVEKARAITVQQRTLAEMSMVEAMRQREIAMQQSTLAKQAKH